MFMLELVYLLTLVVSPSLMEPIKILPHLDLVVVNLQVHMQCCWNTQTTNSILLMLIRLLLEPIIYFMERVLLEVVLPICLLVE
jgi:hypothetical protein